MLRNYADTMGTPTIVARHPRRKLYKAILPAALMCLWGLAATVAGCSDDTGGKPGADSAMAGDAGLADMAAADTSPASDAAAKGTWAVMVRGELFTTDLARASFFSRFSSLVGEPPLRYLTRWRMIEAADLLARDPGISTGRVATRVGYQ
jgi:hypothetical protein